MALPHPYDPNDLTPKAPGYYGGYGMGEAAGVPGGPQYNVTPQSNRTWGSFSPTGAGGSLVQTGGGSGFAPGGGGGGGGGGGFNINPSPQGGQGAFGAVPGPIGLPNPYGDLSAVYPNLSGTNATASGALMDELSGKLSQSTQNTIQDAAATWGVNSGMGGGLNNTIAGNRGLRDLGLASEGQKALGIKNYSSLIPSVSATQTVNPTLQAEIAGTNASNAAAPNPAAAASYAQSLFDRYLAQMSGPAGGTGGGAGKVPWYAGGSQGPIYAQQLQTQSWLDHA